MEYALRVAFFALAPFAIVVAATLVPMTGTFVNIGILLGVFLFAEAVRRRSETRPWLARALRRPLAFEEFYRERPPRHFLYYALYPLVIPYALVQRDARRELFLFKGFGLVGLAIIVVFGAIRFVSSYLPELGVRDFIGTFLVTILIETFVAVSLLLPICTTVVALHQRRQRGRLVALLFVGLVSASVAVGTFAVRRRAFPSLETRARVAKRTAAEPTSARIAMDRALRAAWESRRQRSWEREDDGTVNGAPLAAARAALEPFYRADEAAAFELWTTARKTKPKLMIIFSEGPRRGRPVFLGMHPDGTIVDDVRAIPREGRRAMRTAGDF